MGPIPGRGTRIAGVALVLVLALTAAFLIWRTSGSRVADAPHDGAPTTAAPPTARASTPVAQATSTSPSATPSRPSASPSTTAIAAGCSPRTRPMDDPTAFTIDSMKVRSHMMSLGLDESGAAAAPPKNDSQGVAWFDEGPKVGSDKGNAVLSIHTYRNGGALGNALQDPKTGLKKGALVRITDAHGTTVCYTFERQTKVWVKDYDPMSNVLYDYDGKPQAVIVICWDFNHGTQAWDSRLLYYLKPVAPAA